jgi:alginate O-acetyltransferase complex protein AlgJ
MQAVAADLAAFIRDRDLLDPVPATAYRRVETPQENLGDIAAMLKLPENQTLFRIQRVVTQQVLDGTNMFWRPKRDAEVLLLADSFANIYSMSQLGWGESAGLAEQLSFELGRPLDTIRRNANGAHATRAILSRELSRGRDRLAGKRLVIWEFAVRELAVGDWKSIPMRVGESSPGSFLELPPGEQLELTATVEDIAAPPRPGSVPYKDHIIPMHLANLHAASAPLDGKTDAMVFMWSMRDNVLQPAARYRIGDEVRLRLWAWETVAATMSRINQGELDDPELTLKPFHYAAGPDDPAPEFGGTGFQPADTEAGYKSAPHDDPEQGDTNGSDTAIASADGAPDDRRGEEPDSSATVEDIRKQAASLFDESEGETIVGRDGWLFLPSELRCVSVGPFWGEAAMEASSVESPDYRDPLPAIVDFHKQLADRGIDLWLVPVPAKAYVYPDKLFADVPTPPGGKPPRYDDARQAFADKLKEQGVRVVDLWPLLTDMRSKGEQAYCRTDTHFSPLTTVRIAQELASEIKQKSWYAKETDYRLEERQQSIRGDLSVDGTEPEELPFRFVYDAGGVGRLPVAPDSESPILLLGDSHTLVFHIGEELHATGAGLADQLAAELGMPIDVIGVRGSGATPARINLYREGRSNPGYIEKKKLVIWCFTAREFTEGSGWRKLPVAPK